MKILYINWKGKVEAMSMGNHNFLTYLVKKKQILLSKQEVEVIILLAIRWLK